MPVYFLIDDRWLLQLPEECRGDKLVRLWKCRHCLESPKPEKQKVSKSVNQSAIQFSKQIWNQLSTFSSITCFRIDTAIVSASWRVKSCISCKTEVEGEQTQIDSVILLDQKLSGYLVELLLQRTISSFWPRPNCLCIALPERSRWICVVPLQDWLD